MREKFGGQVLYYRIISVHTENKTIALTTDHLFIYCSRGAYLQSYNHYENQKIMKRLINGVFK